MMRRFAPLLRPLVRHRRPMSTASVFDKPLPASTTLPELRKIPFPGSTTSHFTHEFEFISELKPAIPTYQVMDDQGKLLLPEEYPSGAPVDRELAVRMYKEMVTLNTMDVIMYEAQRQGRVSFYMTNYGEESIIGSAAALTMEDIVYGQYREAGVFLHRGLTLKEFMSQCYSNMYDLGKGRQMPVHYGSRRLNFHSISSPLGTQIPQATGAAYALKRENKKAVSMCYFGDGAASEGDFHAGLNMAATLECPVLFFCRNNGFAISTPTHEQYKGDGIAARGIGYGMATVRVDGNDIFAVYNATHKAREYAIYHSRPVLIEAMTYRVGHHSTSDDSSAYRMKNEADEWARKDNPIIRLRKFLQANDWWSEELEQEWRQQTRKELLKEFAAAETVKKPPLRELFTDVYAEVPPHLQAQYAEMQRIVATYPEFYPTSDHVSEKDYIDPQHQ